MTGKLVIDKSSMVISHFLYSLKIVDNHGGTISRENFEKEMSTFLNLRLFLDDGKRNRTPYNKTKLPRYFGFLDLNEKGDLLLTPRGKTIINNNIIKMREGSEMDSYEKYYISIEDRKKFASLILDSVIFDSFGKNNCGVEQSDSNIEPPKIIFKTINDLKSATKNELAYIIYGLNGGKDGKSKILFNNYYDAIENIKINRSKDFDYEKYFRETGLSTIVSDMKVLNILKDSNINLLKTIRCDDKDELYELSDSVSEEYKCCLEKLSPFYEPSRIFVYSSKNEHSLNYWVKTNILGSVGRSENIFLFDKNKREKLVGDIYEGNYIGGALDEAMVMAYNNPNQNIYLLCLDTNELEIRDILNKYYNLLEIVNDFKSSEYGVSKNKIISEEMYKFIVSRSNLAKKNLSINEVKFPSNLHFIGVKSMDKNKLGNISEPKIKRYILEDIKKYNNKNISRVKMTKLNYKSNLKIKKKLIHRNRIIFGAPGTGKSFKLNNDKNDLLEDGGEYERVTFHPDYSYANFVGTYKPVPVIDSKGEDSISYKYVPGPFMRTYVKAINNCVKANSGEEEAKPYLLLIEEINRANTAAVFGDIFQLLDRKNKISEYPIQTSEDMKKYLSQETGLPSETFNEIKIPDNMFIWATMNSADQGVFPMDTAFKRRWSFEYLDIDENEDEIDKYYVDINGEEIKWNSLRKAINDYLSEKGVNEDKLLGPFFIDISSMIEDKSSLTSGRPSINKGDFNLIFKNKVLMYLFEDAAKQRLTIFNGVDSKTKKRFSKICQSYDEKGINIFEESIITYARNK